MVNRVWRLCMVVHAAYPVAELRVEREARAALDVGCEVTVIALRRQGELPRENVDGVQVVRLPFARSRRFGPLQMAWEYLGFTAMASIAVMRAGFWRRGAIVHVHNPPDFLIACALLPRVCGAAVILDLHDLAPEMFRARCGHMRGAGVIGRLLLSIERLAGVVANAVLAVHAPLARTVEARGIQPAKVHVVMNGLDERLVMSLDQRDDVRGDGGAMHQRIVYHGTIARRYGVDLLVQAAADLSRRHSCTVELYGEGDAVDELLKQRARLGLDEATVHISGVYLPQREVLGLVLGADVGVYCSRGEMAELLPLPTKVMEYVALGIPVVCADLPTIRAHFSEDELRFFTPDDPKALCRAIEEVLQDPPTAKARAAAARHHYETEYAWSVHRKVYISLLGDLVTR